MLKTVYFYNMNARLIYANVNVSLLVTFQTDGAVNTATPSYADAEAGSLPHQRRRMSAVCVEIQRPDTGRRTIPGRR